MQKDNPLFEARRSSSQGCRHRSHFHSAVFLRNTQGREQTGRRIRMVVGKATRAEAQPLNCFKKRRLSLLSVSTCAARSGDVNTRHGDTQAPRQTALPVQALRNTRCSRRLRVDEVRGVFLSSQYLFAIEAMDGWRRDMRLSWR